MVSPRKLSGMFPTTRAASLVLACPDSTERSKSQADFVCQQGLLGANINSYLALMATEHGGCIELAEGDWALEAGGKINVTTGRVWLRGRGRDTAVYSPADSPALDFNITDSYGVKLSDMTIKGGGGSGTKGLTLTRLTNSQFSNLYIGQCASWGIDFIFGHTCGFDNFVIENCAAADFTKGGFGLGTTGNWVNSITFSGHWEIRSCSHALVLQKTNGIRLIGGTIESNNGGGIVSVAASPLDVDFLTVVGTYLEANCLSDVGGVDTYHYIDLTNAGHVVLIGGSLATGTHAQGIHAKYSIYAPATCKQLILVGGWATQGVGTPTAWIKPVKWINLHWGGVSTDFDWTTCLFGTNTGETSASKFGVLGVTPAAQATGGAATAGLVWTATEQGMLQKAYDALRTFGFLS